MPGTTDETRSPAEQLAPVKVREWRRCRQSEHTWRRWRRHWRPRRRRWPGRWRCSIVVVTRIVVVRPLIIIVTPVLPPCVIIVGEFTASRFDNGRSPAHTRRWRWRRLIISFGAGEVHLRKQICQILIHISFIIVIIRGVPTALGL